MHEAEPLTTVPQHTAGTVQRGKLSPWYGLLQEAGTDGGPGTGRRTNRRLKPHFERVHSPPQQGLHSWQCLPAARTQLRPAHTKKQICSVKGEFEAAGSQKLTEMGTREADTDRARGSGREAAPHGAQLRWEGPY